MHIKKNQQGEFLSTITIAIHSTRENSATYRHINYDMLSQYTFAYMRCIVSCVYINVKFLAI